MEKNKKIKRSILGAVLGIGFLTAGAVSFVEQNKEIIAPVRYNEELDVYSEVEETYDVEVTYNLNNASFLDSQGDPTPGASESNTLSVAIPNPEDFSNFSKNEKDATATWTADLSDEFSFIRSVQFDTSEHFDFYRTLEKKYDKDVFGGGTDWGIEATNYFWNQKGMRENDSVKNVSGTDSSDVPKTGNYKKEWDGTERPATWDNSVVNYSLDETGSATDSSNDVWTKVATATTPFEQVWAKMDFSWDGHKGTSGGESRFEWYLNIENSTSDDSTYLNLAFKEFDNQNYDHENIKAIYIPTFTVTGTPSIIDLFTVDISGEENIFISQTNDYLLSLNKTYTLNNTYQDLKDDIWGHIYASNTLFTGPEVDIYFYEESSTGVYDANGLLIEDPSYSGRRFERKELTDPIDASSAYYQIYATGENPLVPEFDSDDGHWNATPISNEPLSYPFLKLSLDDWNDQEPDSGQSKYKKIVKGEKVDTYDLYSNADFVFTFVAPGWVSGEKKYTDLDDNFTPQFATTIMPSTDQETYENWTQEFWISDEDIEGTGFNVVDGGYKANIYEEDGETLLPGLSRSNNGYWAPLELLDEVYYWNEGTDLWSQDVKTDIRWSYLISPEYPVDTGEGEQQIGRKEEQEILLIATSGSDTEEIPDYSLPTTIASMTIYEHFDSTPLLDSEVNSHPELFYSATDEYVEPENSEGLVNDYWDPELYNSKIGKDPFGNIWNDLDNDGVVEDGEAWGLGNDPISNSGLPEYQVENVAVDSEYYNWTFVKGEVQPWESMEQFIEAGGSEESWNLLATEMINEAIDDVQSHWAANGSVTGLTTEHAILAEEDTMSEAYPVIEDTYFIQLFQGDIEQNLDAHTLEEFLGIVEDDTESEHEKVRWFLDQEFMYESNFFIETIEFKEYKEDGTIGWSEWDVSHMNSDDYISRNVLLNEGLETELQFKIVVTDSPSLDKVKSKYMDDNFLVDFFDTDLGYDLAINMLERNVISVPESEDEDDTESPETLMKELLTTELDAPSTYSQLNIMNSGITLEQWKTIEDTEVDGEMTEWQLVSGMTNEDVVSAYALAASMGDIDPGSEFDLDKDGFNLKPGNTVSDEEIKYLKSIINNLLPYTKSPNNNKVNVNDEEWAITFNGYYEKAFDEINYGVEMTDISESRDINNDGLVNLTDAKILFEEWNLDITTDELGNPEGWTSINKIQHESINYSIDADGNEVASNGYITVLRFDITHSVTKFSEVWGNSTLFIPVWVTTKKEKTIRQFNEEELALLMDELEMAEFVFGSPDFVGTWEDYINPEDRTVIEAGSKVNNYNWSHIEDTDGDGIGDTEVQDEVQWADGYEGIVDIYGNVVESENLDGTYEWYGLGDDPSTNADESKDDTYQQWYLTRKDYLRFIMAQNYWQQDVDGNWSISEEDSKTFFKDLFYMISQFNESDITVSLGINGVQMNRLNERELLLSDDQLTLDIVPNSNTNESEWIVLGEAHYSFDVVVPAGMELPDTQPDWVDDSNDKEVSVIGVLITIFLIVSVIAFIITWIKRRKKSKSLI